MITGTKKANRKVQKQPVVWTPVGTKVFLVGRDDSYKELLLNYLYKFWNLACDEIQPPWHEDVFGLKQKSKEIATKSPCLGFIPNSLITPNVLSHSDLKNFETIDKPAKQKCVSRKCQGCKDEEWLCKLNPCEVCRKRINTLQGAQQLSYQSYKYGSNGIHNGCHQDTLLEMTYHGFKCHVTSPNVNMSQGLTALLNSFVSKEKGKFLDSKMSLWKWLRDKTLYGHTYYAYGKEAALDSIIYRLLESMPEDLRQKFSLKTNYSQSCSYDPNHDSFCTFRHNVFPVSADDVLDEHLLQDSNEFGVIQMIKSECTEKSSKIGKSWPQLKT